MKFEKFDIERHIGSKGGVSAQVKAAQYIEYARQLVIERFGEGALEHARPVSIKDRTLMIEVIHPAVSEEIMLSNEAFISALNAKIGYPEVIRISCIIPREKAEWE